MNIHKKKRPTLQTTRPELEKIARGLKISHPQTYRNKTELLAVVRKAERVSVHAIDVQLKKKAFLQAFAECGVIHHACDHAGIHRQTHYLWYRTDAEYALAVEDAREIAIENLEREAVRRAVKGVAEPVYYQGEIVGYVDRKSDTLLIFLLKANKPAKYRDRYELTGADGAPLIPSNGKLSDLSVMQLRDLLALAEKFKSISEEKAIVASDK